MDNAVGAVVGSGIAAQAAQGGGADFLLAINAGRLRNMGAPSMACVLPTHDASEICTRAAQKEILPRVNVPVFLGINCWSAIPDTTPYFNDVYRQGFSGVVNFPPMMLFSDEMKQAMAAIGLAYQREIQLLLEAQRMGLDALFYCSSLEEARDAAQAGVRKVLYNFGWNVGGSFGHQSAITLEEAGVIARSIGLLIKRINPQITFYLEGGPINTSEDLEVVKRYAPVDGYVGGSTLDRVPYEAAVANRIAGYKQAGSQTHAHPHREAEALKWGRSHGFVGTSPALAKFLQGLREFQSGLHPISIKLETGQDVEPLIQALQRGPAAGVRYIDVAQDPVPTQILPRLLGQFSNDRTSFGFLTDPNIHLVVLRNAHLLPKVAQLRLASRLKRMKTPHPKTRASLPISARLLFLEEHAQAQPELMALTDGWRLEYPALRKRASDILRLLQHRAARQSISIFERVEFSASAIQMLRGHLWARNDEELDQFIGLLVSSGLRGTLDANEIRPLLTRQNKVEREILDEKARLVNALWRNGFHRGRTAELLGISRKTLYNKIKKYGL